MALGAAALRAAGLAFGLALVGAGTAVAQTQGEVQGAARTAAAPQRVVSVNLCTDQLAMLLAAPGQLRSVSWLAADPRSSVMAEQAAGLPLNHGGAEEVYLLRPDLVLASSWTRRETVDLLRRLGVTVAEVAPAQGLGDIPRAIREIAALLGREAAGEAMIADFQAGLAALQEAPSGKLAVIYQPAGYTSGSGTLSDEVLRAAGLRNLMTTPGGGYLALERLVMAAPDLVVTSAPWPGASQAEDLLRHPALRALQRGSETALVQDADWVCGLPQVLGAIELLQKAAR